MAITIGGDVGSGRAGTGQLFFRPLTVGLRHFLLPKIRLPKLHRGLAFGATGKLGLFGRLGALFRLPKLLILLKIPCFLEPELRASASWNARSSSIIEKMIVNCNSLMAGSVRLTKENEQF